MPLQTFHACRAAFRELQELLGYELFRLSASLLWPEVARLLLPLLLVLSHLAIPTCDRGGSKRLACDTMVSFRYPVLTLMHLPSLTTAWFSSSVYLLGSRI